MLQNRHTPDPCTSVEKFSMCDLIVQNVTIGYMRKFCDTTYTDFYLAVTMTIDSSS